jgi:hypothetical protein
LSQSNEELQRQQNLQRDLDRIEKQIKELKESQKDGFQDVEGQKKLVAELEKVIPKLDVRTEKNGAVFYDNGANHENGQRILINKERAKAFCEQHGNEHCKTIEKTPGGSWLEKQDLFNGCHIDAAAYDLGKEFSKRFANGASGDVNTFVESKSAEHRTWEGAEKQTLRDNPNVTSINYHYQLAPDQKMIREENLARPSQEKVTPEPQEQSPQSKPEQKQATIKEIESRNPETREFGVTLPSGKEAHITARGLEAKDNPKNLLAPEVVEELGKQKPGQTLKLNVVEAEQTLDQKREQQAKQGQSTEEKPQLEPPKAPEQERQKPEHSLQPQY